MDQDPHSPLDVEEVRSRVHKVLDEFVTAQQQIVDVVSEDLDPVMSAGRGILSGGKRLRPAFAYWGWRAGGGSDCEEIVRAATALEFLQACALIHDDVMDDSDTRRGRPSVHRTFARLHRGSSWLGSSDAFGTGAAILLGDLMLSWADELLFRSGIPEASLLRAKPVYDRMRTELMAGQYLDLLEQARGGGSVERALQVARYKSAKYTVEGPLHLGATLAGADDQLLREFTQYGLPLGEAFQLRDDVLGVFGDPDRTGKPAGDDLREGKRTVLVALTLDRATPAQNAVFRQRFGDPHLDDEGLALLRQVIDDTGSKEQVEQLITAQTAEASQALARIDEPARTVLMQLAHAATSRSG